MYAVVKTGGKQYRVEDGDVLTIEKLSAEVGETVEFAPLLVSEDGSIKTGDEAAAVAVTGEVVEHFRGQKVIVFKFQKRKRHKKLNGHRQSLTKVKITGIGSPAPKKKAAAKATAEDKPKAARKPAAKKTTEAAVEAPTADASAE